MTVDSLTKKPAKIYPRTWADQAWNVCTGCSFVSRGCQHCYARSMAIRFQEKYDETKDPKMALWANGFKVTLRPERLEWPLKRWKRPKFIFMLSMGDLWHPDVPNEYRDRVFDVIDQTKHIYMWLTKRVEPFTEYVMKRYGGFPPQVWPGCTIENQDAVHRIEHLIKTPSKLKWWVNAEPLVGPLVLNDHLLESINYLAVGGEVGFNSTPTKLEWVIDLMLQTKAHSVPFSFMTWGHHNEAGVKVGPKESGKLVCGKEYSDFPDLDALLSIK